MMTLVAAGSFSTGVSFGKLGVTFVSTVFSGASASCFSYSFWIFWTTPRKLSSNSFS